MKKLERNVCITVQGNLKKKDNKNEPKCIISVLSLGWIF